MFQRNEPLYTLHNIHNQCFLTTMYKINSNVALICQRFCANVVINELGLDQNTTSTIKTYIQEN